MFKKYVLSIMVLALCAAGCGYSTRSLLPSNYKSIYVDSFGNKIKISAEQSNLRMYRGYRPGLEANITRAVIDKYLFDGNLKIAEENCANIILKGELIDFRKEPLRYDANDNIEEFRLVLTVNMELIDAATGKIVWKEKAFSGETTYRTQGPLAVDENTAVQNGVTDIARRIVERTVEGW
jgi:hypothetical protein